VDLAGDVPDPQDTQVKSISEKYELAGQSFLTQPFLLLKVFAGHTHWDPEADPAGEVPPFPHSTQVFPS
jgi:hypothetical protein